MATVTLFLWFDGTAEQAAEFYVSVFPRSKIVEVSRGAEGAPAQSAVFELDGREIIAFNGGPMYHFTPATSLLVACETQDEIDRYWDALVVGGEPLRCGWITDRFGLTWQIVPAKLPEMLQDKNPQKASAVMTAMMPMVKLDIDALEAAYASA
jgi:predicted 3-demethylubiquinone-9 3-methyltransferase (glyoxalase superfamily)